MSKKSKSEISGPSRKKSRKFLLPKTTAQIELSAKLDRKLHQHGWIKHYPPIAQHFKDNPSLAEILSFLLSKHIGLIKSGEVVGYKEPFHLNNMTLTSTLGISNNEVRKHIKKLADSGYIEKRTIESKVFYTINHEKIDEIFNSEEI